MSEIDFIGSAVQRFSVEITDTSTGQVIPTINSKVLGQRDRRVYVAPGKTADIRDDVQQALIASVVVSPDARFTDIIKDSGQMMQLESGTRRKKYSFPRDVGIIVRHRKY